MEADRTLYSSVGGEYIAQNVQFGGRKFKKVQQAVSSSRWSNHFWLQAPFFRRDIDVFERKIVFSLAEKYKQWKWK